MMLLLAFLFFQIVFVDTVKVEMNGESKEKFVEDNMSDDIMYKLNTITKSMEGNSFRMLEFLLASGAPVLIKNGISLRYVRESYPWLFWNESESNPKTSNDLWGSITTFVRVYCCDQDALDTSQLGEEITERSNRLNGIFKGNEGNDNAFFDDFIEKDQHLSESHAESIIREEETDKVVTDDGNCAARDEHLENCRSEAGWGVVHGKYKGPAIPTKETCIIDSDEIHLQKNLQPLWSFRYNYLQRCTATLKIDNNLA